MLCKKARGGRGEGEREETIGNRRSLHSLLDPLLKYHIFFKSLSLDLLALPVFTSETRNYRSKKPKADDGVCYQTVEFKSSKSEGIVRSKTRAFGKLDDIEENRIEAFGIRR